MLEKIINALDNYLFSRQRKHYNNWVTSREKYQMDLQQRGFGSHFKSEADHLAFAFKDPLVAELVTEIEKGNTKSLNDLLELLEKNPMDQDDKRDEKFGSLLMLLARSNYVPNLPVFMQLLIEHGANKDHKEERTCIYQTPLAEAMRSDVNARPNWPAIKTLIDNNADTHQEVKPPMITAGGAYHVQGSTIKRFCGNPLEHTYQDLATLHKIIENKLRNDTTRLTSCLHPLPVAHSSDGNANALTVFEEKAVKQVIAMRLFSQPNNGKNYFTLLKQLERDKAHLEKTMKQREQGAYLRLSSLMSVVGMCFIPKSVAHPVLTFAATSILVAKALASLNEETSLIDDCEVIKVKLDQFQHTSNKLLGFAQENKALEFEPRKLNR